MPIRLAEDKQFLDIMFLLRKCAEDMNRNNMFHWNNFYPSAEIIREDMAKSNLYILEENGIIKGMVVLNREQSTEYEEISWNADSDNVLVVHRLAVHPVFQGQGIGKKLMEFALVQMKEQNFSAIRLDVIESNQAARKLYIKMGFRETGHFHFPFQESPFTCYEFLGE